jgi:hypothetical protein
MGVNGSKGSKRELSGVNWNKKGRKWEQMGVNGSKLE